MRIDYASHDGSYRKRKAEGYAGWDKTDEDYEKFRNSVEKDFSMPGVPGGGKVLEIGCGAGNTVLWLAQKGYEAHGVDIAPTAIEWAKEKAVSRNVPVAFKVGNVLDLQDFADGAFDIVIDGHCLHCIIGDDRRRCLASVFRVLKQGGWFFVHSMCRTNMPVTAQGFDPASGIIFNKGFATRYIGTKETMLAELVDAGFKAESYMLDIEEQEKDSGIAGFSGAMRKP